MVTRRLQVERRTEKVRRPRTFSTSPTALWPWALIGQAHTGVHPYISSVNTDKLTATVCVCDEVPLASFRQGATTRALNLTNCRSRNSKEWKCWKHAWMAGGKSSEYTALFGETGARTPSDKSVDGPLTL